MDIINKTKEELIIGLRELQLENISLKATIEKDRIDRKEAEEEILRHSRELATLLKISQELATTLDLGKILQIIADRVTELTETNSSAIYLLEEETLCLWATTPPLPPQFKNELRYAPLADHPHIQKAITTGKPVFLPDTAKADLTPAERAVCELRNLSSILYLPLFVGTQALGVLIVTTSDTPKKHSESEINLFNTFANLAAIGVGNATLYESQIRHARELENRVEELKLAEEARRKSDEKYKTLFNANTDGITIFNLRGEEMPSEIMDMNENAAKMLGYSIEEMKEINPNELELNITKDKINKRIEDLKIKGFSYFETSLRHKNGHEIFVEIKVLIFDYAGQPALMNIARDITVRKMAEIELMHAKERAEESDRLKSAFLANMSHEIRTPMNGILGFAELLKEPKLSGEEQQEYISIIEKSGLRMLNIIKDIVDISKIESGLMEVKLHESNINEQIDYIYSFFKPETDIKSLQFSCLKTLSGNKAIIQTDKEKIYAILTNLVKNAIKYTDTGSIEVGYILKKENHSDVLEFFIKDTGIGIRKDRQEAIFERFIQADIQDVNARQGAGLGLTISKAYAGMLGGTIRVESEEGEGSTFYFTLPYQSIIDEGNSDNEISNPNSTREIKIKSLDINVLIVEDDEASAKFLAKIIGGISSNNCIVQTGQEAVNGAKNIPNLDLILMDIQIPDMNGYEATREIRQFNKEVIIIAQTAFALIGDREKALEAGCNDYIEKPIQKNRLLDLIREYFH